MIIIEVNAVSIESLLELSFHASSFVAWIQLYLQQGEDLCSIMI